jgi:hypothetical protein
MKVNFNNTFEIDFVETSKEINDLKINLKEVYEKSAIISFN